MSSKKDILRAWRNFPMQTLEEFKKGLKKISKETRTSPEKVVRNILKNNIHDEIYISGVISAQSYHSKKYNKHVCLFGEIHREDKCPSVSSSITNLIRHTILSNPEKLIDIFVETSFAFKNKKRPLVEPKSAIDLFEEEFEHCFSYEKACPYPNARFHYADIRNTMPHIYGKLVSLLYQFEDGKTPKKQIEKAIKSYTFEKFEYDLENTKIKKQIRNIPYDDVKKHLETKYEIVRKKVQILLKSINSTKDIEVLKVLIRKLHLQESRVMDLYILGRMFRKFKTLKSRPIDSPKYIFIYGGETHIYRISRTLEKFGFGEGFIVESDISCVNGSGLLPIFG